MSLAILERFPRSRPKALLARFAVIEDKRKPCRGVYPLAAVLVVCGTIRDCEDSDLIAAWATITWTCCVAMRRLTTACRAGAGRRC